jgi:hypothetical protein
VRRWLLGACAAAACLWAGGAAAQEEPELTCAGTLTVAECFRAMLGEYTEGQGEAVDDEVTRATTGAQAETDAVSTAVRDFLPRVAGALLLPGVDEDRKGLSLRLNRQLGAVSLQLGADLNDPTLYGALVEGIPESIRAASTERLESQLEDQDDVTLSVALNLEGTEVGRSLGPHRNEVSRLVSDLADVPEALQADAFATLPRTLILGFAGARLPEKQSEPACAADLRADQVALDCLRPSYADSLRAALSARATANLAIGQRRAAALQAPAFVAIAQLLNNQPQLNGTFTYHHRDDLVGPDEWSFTLRGEMGRYNLNWLRGRCGAGLTADCLLREMTPERLDALAQGARAWFSAEGSLREAYDLALAADSVNLHLDEALELTFKGGYGQYFGRLSEDGTRRPRVDVEVGYVLQRDDAAHNSRATASLSYTHPFSSTAAGVFGVRWANEAEFLDDVDRNLTATLGVTYKLVNGGDR